MISTSERRIIEEALALAIATKPSPRVALVAMVSEAEFAVRLPLLAPDARALAEAAIQMCIESRWAYIPPWLAQVLGQVTQTPEIAAILAKIADVPPDWSAPVSASPFDAQWLPRPGLPFLNRAKLRASLRRLDSPAGPSVLIINGAPGFGKSYSVELITHIVQENTPAARQELPVPVGLVTLQPGMGASLTPEVLARMMVERIQPDPEPPANLGDEQDAVTADRLNEHLCDWIVLTAQGTGKRWWIMLDGLDDPDLTPATRNFISKLVELLSTGKHRKQLRLVVTDYPPERVTGVPQSQMETERLGPIGDVDLQPFFEEQLRTSAGPPVPEAVRIAIIMAMGHLPHDETHLQVLNDRLRGFVELLSRERGNG